MQERLMRSRVVRHYSIAVFAGLLALAQAGTALAISGTTNHVWHAVGGSASFMRGTPAFGSDGTIYIGSGDNNLYAFNPDGTTNHVWTTGADIIGSAAIGSNGTIYVGSTDNKVWSFNPDGTTNYSWYLGSSTYSTPAIDANGTVYIGDLAHKFYALNPTDGTTSHVWNAGGDFRGFATIAADGTIYVGNDDHKLYGYNPNGTTNHVWDMSGQIYHGPTISSNGTIYIGDQSGYFWAFNSDGTTSHVWKISDMVYHSTAVIGTNGMIYVGAFSTISTLAYCFGLNPDGTTNRAWLLSSRYSMNSPVIGENGTVFIGSEYSLFGLNPTTGATNITWYLGSDMMSGVTIGPDNNIYVGCENGSFFSLAGLKPMANTYYPRQHQNLRNTGSILALPWIYVPTNVCATDGSYYNRVVVTWDDLPMDTDYLVYRGLTSTSPALLATSTSNSYSDTTGVADVTYYYWVKATNAVFTSSLSDYCTGSRAEFLLPPRPPANVRATDGTYTNRIRVTWKAVTNAFAYEVYRNLTNVSGTCSRLGGSSGISYNDYTATADITYYFWVKAVNDAGTSSFSAAASGKCTATSTAPSAPQNVEASSGAYTNKVALTWDQVSSANSYKIYRSTSSDSASAVWIADATVESVEDTSVTVGTVYYYWVMAVNDIGSSAYSSPASGYATAAITVPSTPANVSASKAAYIDRVQVTWTAVSNAASYEVWRSGTNDSTTAAKSGDDPTVAWYEDSSIVVDIIYYYWIKAKNEAGTSAFSSSAYGYATNAISVPSAPADVAATRGTYTNLVRVTWTAVSNAASYEVWRSRTNDSTTAANLSNDTAVASYEDSSVVVDIIYYYWVKAKNDSGTSAFSSSACGYATNAISVPSAPADVAATRGTYIDRVQVTWTAVSDATSYEVWRSATNDSTTAGKSGNDTTVASYEDSSVVVDIAYYYWIKAKNNYGTSPFSLSDMGFASSRAYTCWLPVVSDYDGDKLADPAVYRPATGTWRLKMSSAGYYLFTTASGFLGGTNYTGLAADFDGDAKADPAVYSTLTGNWSIRLSTAGYLLLPDVIAFGGTNYASLAADFDGDAKADPAIYDSSTADWFIKLSSAGYQVIPLHNFMGTTGWTALAADFDGDAKADPVIYNNHTGYWIFKLSGIGYVEIAWMQTMGGTGYVPVPADYDGDGLADPAIYNAANAYWSIKLSSAGYYQINLPNFLGGTE